MIVTYFFFSVSKYLLYCLFSTWKLRRFWNMLFIENFETFLQRWFHLEMVWSVSYSSCVFVIGVLCKNDIIPLIQVMVICTTLNLKKKSRAGSYFILIVRKRLITITWYKMIVKYFIHITYIWSLVPLTFLSL